MNRQAPFITYMDDEVQRLSRAQRFGQARRTASVRNSFATYLATVGAMHATRDDITPQLIGDYQQWLHIRGVKKNSSSCYMRTLQGLYNRTRTGGDTSPTPFAHVYRGIAKTRKRATSIDVIRQLSTLDIRSAILRNAPSAKRSPQPRVLRKLALARDLFIFSYCARGMAFVDVAYLRKTDLQGGTIRYVRRKTGQQIEVAVEPAMRTIINRYAADTTGSPYLFPILPQADAETTYRAYRSALRTYNDHLSQLSRLLGLEVRLTSYVARHSWASNMHELNMPLSVISQGLGHDSELTTQIYIKSLDSSTIHKANRTLLEQLFSPRFLPHEREKQDSTYPVMHIPRQPGRRQR